MYFLIPMYVANLFRFFVGAYFKPLSNTANSSVVRVCPLKLKIPSPLIPFFFWNLFPALHPLLFLGFFCFFPPVVVSLGSLGILVDDVLETGVYNLVSSLVIVPFGPGLKNQFHVLLVHIGIVDDMNWCHHNF